MTFQPQPKYRIQLRKYRMLYWPLLLPVAMLLALFNKISPVPFKIYSIRVDRVGQMAANQEDFLCELEHGLHPKEFRVFVHRDRPSNQVLLDMLKRVMPIHQIFLPMFDVCHKLGGLGVSSMFVHNIPGSDPNRVCHRSSRHLSFTKKEEAEARRQCAELGIDTDMPFVPVLGRDTAYLDSISEPTDRRSYRNVDINSFVPAMEYLGDNQYKVIRMGSVVKDKLKSNHPNVIDYSLSGKRTELLDIYLAAKCTFFLTVGSGIDAIATTSFGRPTLYVHYTPVGCVSWLRPGTLCILKKYWHIGEERYLGLRELLQRGIEHELSPVVLNPMDITVVDNTPEEIVEGVREMCARLDGTWKDTAEDKDLQGAFWEIIREFYPGHREGCTVGALYLRNNPFWVA